MSNSNVIFKDFLNLLKQAATDTGKEFKVSLDEIATYASERAAHLSTLVGDPDFLEAVVAERDNVIAKAGLAAVDRADAIDSRIIGIVQGALALGAKLLVP